MSTESLTLATADGQRLAGRLRLPPAGAVTAAAVLCHPHPAFGGNMDVWLLPRLGERLAQGGWAVLRFNFRPEVGDGRPAVADVAAAVDEVVQRAAGVERVALVGWSFGALAALLYGTTDPRVTDWVGIAPPTQSAPPGWAASPLAPVPAGVSTWRARRTVIVGAHDQFYPADQAHVFAADELHVIADADHFFFDRDEEIAELVAGALSRGTAVA